MDNFNEIDQNDKQQKNIIDKIDDDHHKFFKKIEVCFSSNNGRNRGNSSDYVDEDERRMKQKMYSEKNNFLNEGLRASLSD